MRLRSWSVLAALTAASCFVPGMNIVDSFGDAGEAGAPAGGAGAAGVGGKAGGGGRGGAGTSAGGTSGAAGRGEPNGGKGGRAGSGAAPPEAGNDGEAGDGAGAETGSGGDSASGGSSSGGSSSGTAGMGGTAGTNGMSGAGGTAGTGGTSGAAGASGTAGASGAGSGCGSVWAVGTDGFVTTPASMGLGGDSCWHGYPYVAITGNTTITPEEFSMCGPNCQLCVNGTVPADVTYSSFAILGFNLNQVLGQPTSTAASVTPTGNALLLHLSNTLGRELRVQLHAAEQGLSYCYVLPADAATVQIPWSSFRTECWQMGGTNYAGTPIVAIEIAVPGLGDAAVPFDFCLLSAADGG